MLKSNNRFPALEERYQARLRAVLKGWDTNSFAEIVTKDGKATLDLSKDEKLLLPATVEPLRDAILSVMPHARLADVFIEVEDWVGFRDLFCHLNERQNTPTRDPWGYGPVCGDPGTWPQSATYNDGRIHGYSLS